MADERKDARPSLKAWLETAGPAETLMDVLALYQAAFGPLHPVALRRRLWDECGVAVNPHSGRLVLPDDWPDAAPPTRH